MKDKNTTVMIVLLILAMLGIFYIYQVSYAKYKKNINGSMVMNMAKWQILVNNEDIKNKTTLTNNLTPVFNGTQYIESGIIAPGASGYFDIEIDPNDTDVAFSYEISITENSTYPDIKLDGYEINPGNTPNKSPLVICSGQDSNILNSSSFIWPEIISHLYKEKTGLISHLPNLSNNNKKIHNKSSINFYKKIDYD